LFRVTGVKLQTISRGSPSVDLRRRLTTLDWESLASTHSKPAGSLSSSWRAG
jgi:hypothetical protein